LWVAIWVVLLVEAYVGDEFGASGAGFFGSESFVDEGVDGGAFGFGVGAFDAVFDLVAAGWFGLEVDPNAYAFHERCRAKGGVFGLVCGGPERPRDLVGFGVAGEFEVGESAA